MKKGILLLSYFLYANLFGQDNHNSILVGNTFQIKSKVLNEERPISISLPDGYSSTQKRYPVLYLLDGSEYEFIRSAGMVRYISGNIVPEMIVVGIPNTNRLRDLAVTKLEEFPVTTNQTGADNFIRFLKDELIPYINSRFRTTDYRIIYGGSAAGTFALYTLFFDPDVFNAYITSSPAPGLGNNFLLSKAEECFSKGKALDNYLYIIYGTEDFAHAANSLPKLISDLKNKKPKGLKWDAKILEGVGHVPYNSLLEGLRSLFLGWEELAPPKIVPAVGFITDGKLIQVSLSSKLGDIYYTLNGEEPTKQSNKYEKPILIQGNSVLKAKAIKNNLDESPVSVGNYSVTTSVHPIVGKVDLEPGLSYKYNEGQRFNMVSEIKKTALKEGVADVINLEMRQKDYEYSLTFEGYINIKKEGIYQFFLYSNCTSKLVLADSVSIDHEFNQSLENSVQLFLKKGFYPVKVIYSNWGIKGNELSIKHSGPGFTEQPIPANVLFH